MWIVLYVIKRDDTTQQWKASRPLFTAILILINIFNIFQCLSIYSVISATGFLH